MAHKAARLDICGIAADTLRPHIDAVRRSAPRVCLVMYARRVDEASEQLRELRKEEWENLGLGALALGLAVTAAEVRPALAAFLGGLVVGGLGMRALLRRKRAGRAAGGGARRVRHSGDPGLGIPGGHDGATSDARGRCATP